jgi:hypothetical protein
MGGLTATDAGGLCPDPAVGLSRVRCRGGTRTGSGDAERLADALGRPFAQGTCDATGPRSAGQDDEDIKV